MIRIVEKLENAIQTIILFVIRVTLPRRKIIFAAFVWKTVLWLLRLSSMGVFPGLYSHIGQS